MEWLRFRDLARAYGAREVFAGVGGVLRDGERVGLVGPNGAGKSSLVRILAGVDEPDAGEIVRARESVLGYLSQTASEERDVTLRALLERAFERRRNEEAALRALEAEIADAATRGDEATQETLLRRYGNARETFERHGGADADRRMRSMLAALGFSPSDLERSVGEFSGGQRTRATLARVLLDEPDYLILDEPTNHLDIETVLWLERFITEDPRAFLIVSHDRLFLDRVATRIWELDGGSLESYDSAPEPYTSYLAQKAERIANAERAYERAVAEREREKAVIAELRTHGSHNYVQVKSREKRLGKAEPLAPPKTTQKKLSVDLGATREASTGVAVTVKDVAKTYATPLFTGVRFELQRGDRFAILGPNGAGKSTLLRIIEGTLRPDAGSIRFGPGIKVASFSQSAVDALPANLTAADAVKNGTNATDFQARSLLGRLGLGGDAVEKRVDAFSGGERRRIMLARLMAQPADLLLLDEPTNDLDIPSREALEAELDAYPGAMIVVSHDRYLLRRLIDRFIWLHDGTWTRIDGGFAAYERAEIEQKRGGVIERPVAAKSAPATAQPRPNANAVHRERQRLEKEAAKRESAIAKLDARKAEIEREFADPALYDDRERVGKLRAELERIEREADAALADWERMLEQIESLATSATA